MRDTITITRFYKKNGLDYYPFGLSMSGVSSKSAGTLENKKKYNGIEYENSFDVNFGEAFFRTHDPQLGRWWQIDPKPTEMFSPYCSMNNNPLLLSDPLGDTTWVYNQKGVMLGMIPDHLKNQVHYMKGEDGKNGQIDTKGLSAKEIKDLAKSYRSSSMAFMGSKTKSDMQSIIKKSLDARKEVSFVGSIGADREIRLKSLPILSTSTMNSNAPITAIDGSYSKGQQAGLFLWGHTHIAGYLGGWQAPGGGINNQTQFGAPTNPEDYLNTLYRSPNATSRGATPALLLTPWGLTAYGSDQLANKGTNNSYILYKSIKE